MPIGMARCFGVMIVTLGLAACQVPSGQPGLPVRREGGLASPPAAAEPVRMTSAAATPMDPDLPTPALIDRAYAQGEISAGQRLLYLAYAVYEHTSLPAQFRSDAGWRGTAVVREIRQAVADPNVMCGLAPGVQAELRRLLQGEAPCEQGQ